MGFPTQNKTSRPIRGWHPFTCQLTANGFLHLLAVFLGNLAAYMRSGGTQMFLRNRLLTIVTRDAYTNHPFPGLLIVREHI